MGKYLKEQYEMRDISKALAKVHKIIDNDYQKLYDENHEYELSHNRKAKLLLNIEKFLKTLHYDVKEQQARVDTLLLKIRDELGNYGRARYNW